jgi:hypothetical protein
MLTMVGVTVWGLLCLRPEFHSRVMKEEYAKAANGYDEGVIAGTLSGDVSYLSPSLHVPFYFML